MTKARSQKPNGSPTDKGRTNIAEIICAKECRQRRPCLAAEGQVALEAWSSELVGELVGKGECSLRGSGSGGTHLGLVLVTGFCLPSQANSNHRLSLTVLQLDSSLGMFISVPYGTGWHSSAGAGGSKILTHMSGVSAEALGPGWVTWFLNSY